MLFTFPSRYWFAIGLLRVFSLGGWARRIHTGFLVSRATQDTAMLHMASNKGLSPATAQLSSYFFSPYFLQRRSPTTPSGPESRWFGLFPVRSPLLGESLNYFLFLEVLRCFSSLRSPHCISSDDRPSACRVVPFGNPWIKGYLHLPKAYRSLSRPSSPP